MHIGAERKIPNQKTLSAWLTNYIRTDSKIHSIEIYLYNLYNSFLSLKKWIFFYEFIE